MAATIGAAAAVLGAGASLGSALSGTSSNNDQQIISAILQEQQLQQNKQNMAYQQAVQQMVNNRAVAGTTDSFGTTVQYDPTTNTWNQKLGALPQAADAASLNASITRNTTDLMQQELANRVSMNRAAQAGNAYDTAQRNLANYRPMSADQLTALLTQQGVEAARQSYDPLRADTLRQLARTGTAAGPVLRQLGLGEAQNLRNTLIDAQIQGLQNVGSINNTNQTRLINALSAAQSAATPTLQQGNLGTSGTDALIQQLTGTRAQWAPSSTAQGAYGTNQAVSAGNVATNSAAGAVPNTNFNLQQMQSALKDISQFANNPGTGGLSQTAKTIGSWLGLTGNDQSSATNTNWNVGGGTYTDPYTNTGDVSGQGLSGWGSYTVAPQ